MLFDNFEPFISPATIQISAPSGSGKTIFTRKIIQHKHIMFPRESPDEVMYCYGAYQPLFDDMEREFPFITFHQGLPSEDMMNDFGSSRKHKLIVLDDLMQQAAKSQDTELLFTQKSHHMNLSVIFISQNLYCKNTKTLSLNCHYLVLFRNFRDGQQINCLGRQIFPKSSQKFLEAYKDATSKPYGYILIDLSPHSHDELRLRTHIFPDDECIIVYKS